MFHSTRIILVLYIAFVSTPTITSTENSNTLSATRNATSTTENFVKPISAAGKNSSIQSNDTSHQLGPDQHMVKMFYSNHIFFDTLFLKQFRPRYYTKRNYYAKHNTCRKEKSFYATFNFTLKPTRQIQFLTIKFHKNNN